MAATMKKYISLMLFDEGIFGEKLSVEQKK